MEHALKLMAGDVIENADPLERARRSTQLLDDLAELTQLLSHNRRNAVQEAIETTGITKADIARELGITKGRVNHILYGKEGLGGRTAVKPAKVAKVVAAPEPTHRHHYEPVSWTRNRGMYVITKACQCGATRVDEAATPPRGLEESPAGA